MKTENIVRTVAIVALAVLFLAIAVSGLMVQKESHINTIYGQRFGQATQSVNGTSVFAEMFSQAGAQVTTTTRLSPRLARSQTVVWAPNSFELPSKEEIKFLSQNWLRLDDGEDRTLVYIARDYEGAIEYYREQANSGAIEDFVENTRRKARSQSDHAYLRSLTGRVMQCKWFSIEPKEHFFEVQPTDGRWISELDNEQSNAPSYLVSGILTPPPEDTEDSFGFENQILLRSNETPLVMEIRDQYNWPNARILVVLNGSSLLNYPLVKHQNRKLAAKVIDHCEQPRHVTFLESGPGGPYITQSNSALYSGFGPLTVWPINAILLHLIAAGILFCMMVFPIFGRPREVISDEPNDFGKHVDAIRRLLEISDNRDLAIEKVNAYRQLEADSATTSPKRNVTGNPFKVSEV